MQQFWGIRTIDKFLLSEMQRIKQISHFYFELLKEFNVVTRRVSPNSWNDRNAKSLKPFK